MYYYYYSNYGLILLALAISLIAQGVISINYSKYKKIKNKKGITGAEVAREILSKNGLDNVYVVETGGHLSDHYDSRRKTVRLSSEIYNGVSIAAIAVAAHECGHALQDKNNYVFLRIRSMLVPLVNFSSYAGYLAVLIGIIFSYTNLIWIGIILECVILLFQLITLPVEFNASSRALKKIKEYNIVDNDELKGSRKMLTAAAMTYVASVASAVLQILRLVLIARDRD